MPVGHYIDPGFVNDRLVETVVGDHGSRLINEMVAQIPATTPDWQKRTRLNHIYTRVALEFCKTIGAPTLRKIMAERKGTLICSTEQLAPCPTVYDAERVQVPVVLDEEHDLTAELHFSTEHISSGTTRSQLHQGDVQSFIAIVKELKNETLVLHPLVLGSPWLESDDPQWKDRIEWFGHEFYEVFVEDFAEFAKVLEEPVPADWSAMQNISERAFKTCLAEILNDSVTADWGGEQSDHFSSHVTLGGHRVAAAFLLKGPARFAPMGLNNLGKNNDQIVRLANEPADVLVVQHCHDILQPVRATLRAFAVQPSRPRRYCLLDGRDSFRLLRAYGKLDRALALSA